MKKLLVLMLVLVMAASASAAISDYKATLSGTTLTIVGLNASASFTGDWIGTYDMSTVFSGPVAKVGSVGDYNAGSTSNILLDVGATYTGIIIDVGDGLASDPVVLGDWFTVQYSGSVGDILTVEENPGSVFVGTLEVLVPEPMTIALLGLGGLFLRRKK